MFIVYMTTVCKHVYRHIGVAILNVLWERRVHDITHGGTVVEKDPISIYQLFMNWVGLSKIITQLEGLCSGPTVIS